MAASLFRLEAIEFQRRRGWAGEPTALPVATWLLTCFFLVSVVSAVSFLALGSYSRKETVSGYLTPVGGIAKVLPAATGVVTELYVADGDRVTAGQRLLLVRSGRRGTQGEAVDATIIDRLQAKRDAIEERIEIEQKSAAMQKQSLSDALAGLEANVSSLADSVRTARERLDVAHAQVEAVRPTVAAGLTSKTEFRQRQDTELAQQQALRDLYRQASDKAVDANEKRQALAELETKTADNLAVLRSSVADAAANLAEARGKQGYVVFAPVAGRVNNLQAWVGMNVETSLPLLSIVPENAALEVSLMVPARAIGFVMRGQNVRFAFDPFPSQQFGTYSGTIVSVADALLKPNETVGPMVLKEASYRVVARLERQTITAYGGEIGLRPDMSLKADIVFDRRSLIAWLFDPLLSVPEECEGETMTHSLTLNPWGGAVLPDIRQAEAAECGLACLAMVAGFHGRHMDLGTLRRRHPVSVRGASLRSVMSIAAELDMAARPLRLEMDHLRELKLPAILHWDMDHFVVLRRVSRNGVTIHDPATGARRYSFLEAGRHFTGVALELSPTREFSRVSERSRLRLRDILIWPHGGWMSVVQALLLSVLLQAYVLASPFYMQIAMDDAVAQNDHDLLAVLAMGFGLFLVINVGAGLLRSLALVHLQTGLAYELSSSVLRHLLRLPLDFFEKRRTGDLLSRFSATDPIRDMLTEGVMSAAVDGVMAVLMGVMIFVYSATLACIVIPALALCIILRIVTYRILRARSLTSLQAKARETGMFVETLRAIQTIKVFNRENERCGLWTNCRIEVLNADAAVARLKAIFRSTNELVFGIENLLVIYFGASAVLNGGMSVGMLFAFMSYKTQFVEKAARFVERAIEFRMLDVQLERLADIVTTDPEPDVVAPSVPASYRQSLEGAVEVRGLSFRYGEDEPFVFENASFSIAQGEYVAITGPSGGGKTTLIKVMLGLLAQTSGEILIDGMPLRQFGVRAFRDQVGVVMQDDQLMSGSVADNICCFDEAFDVEWMQRCAETAGIHDEIMRMPMGYNSLIGDMGTFLSGGQKQRIVLARALYRRPRILFMDEGTSHLDVALEARVNSAVKALGLTRIIIAHRPETIASASRVLTVREGLVAEPDGRVPVLACDS